MLRSSRAAGADELWQVAQFFWRKESAPANGGVAATAAAEKRAAATVGPLKINRAAGGLRESTKRVYMNFGESIAI